jgi:hypothetical protein
MKAKMKCGPKNSGEASERAQTRLQPSNQAIAKYIKHASSKLETSPQLSKCC